MKFGDFDIFVMSDGTFRLDGGAMFGVVPKVLWNKLNPADELNRIGLGLNCLLIKDKNDIILVDTGIGDNYDEKFAGMFGIDKSNSLRQSLKTLGIAPDQVTKVVLTHLHFDHCGGNCVRAEDGSLSPAFPNATYFMQKGELAYASHPDPRSRGSYLAHNWQPLEKNGQIELISGDSEIVPGLEVNVTGGHTEYHQIVRIKTNGQSACFLADLVPTHSHLKTAYVMGYDLYPKTTMEMKERILKQALEEHWLLIFEHTAEITAGYLYEREGKMELEKIEVR